MYETLLVITAIYMALYFGFKIKTAVYYLLLQVFGEKVDYKIKDLEFSMKLPPQDGWKSTILHVGSYSVLILWGVICVLYW